MTPPQEHSFATSYDQTTKILSAALAVLFAALFIATKSVFVGIPGLCILALAYLYSPRSYQVSDRSIRIKRLVGTVCLSIDSIRELRAGTAEDFRKCIRLWGSGGLFGYYGWFRTAKLGKCKWYVTNRSKAVVVVADELTVVLSPDDVAGFLNAVRSVAAIPETAGVQTPSTMSSAKTGLLLGAWIGGGIAILVACVVGFALMYSPGAPKWTLTPNSLTIRDRFYPVTVNAADVDVNGIKVVNIRTDPQWKPTERTDGFANAHYHSGWFRVANGSARMYWADGANLVLLPPRQSGAPVLLQVSDPEQFVEKIHEEWTNH